MFARPSASWHYFYRNQPWSGAWSSITFAYTNVYYNFVRGPAIRTWSDARFFQPISFSNAGNPFRLNSATKTGFALSYNSSHDDRQNTQKFLCYNAAPTVRGRLGNRA